ncbi:MAG: patatin-like phospholipase family protein [Nocardioidaceae bacterium]
MLDPRRTDLVLEGGGVKGIALAGATTALTDAGYTFPRIAGTSAGAIVGAVLAALVHAGEPLARAGEVARTLDYSRFRDRGRLGRLLGPLGFVVDGFSLLLENGIYEGAYLHDWLSGVLADLGVRTFGDLRRDDPGSDLPAGHDYGLVVTASDLSRQRLVRLPWDYPAYGLDPDEMAVADAVRASASIPFFFEPVTMAGRDGVSTLVDGGLLSNYPITIFDREDLAPARWPTIGVRLSGRVGEHGVVRPVNGAISLALSVIDTTIEACQAQHVADPCTVARSVFIDTTAVSSTDFGITPAQLEALYAAGLAAGQEFAARWDFDRWRTTCGKRPA